MSLTCRTLNVRAANAGNIKHTMSYIAVSEVFGIMFKDVAEPCTPSLSHTTPPFQGSCPEFRNQEPTVNESFENLRPSFSDRLECSCILQAWGLWCLGLGFEGLCIV